LLSHGYAAGAMTQLLSRAQQNLATNLSSTAITNKHELEGWDVASSVGHVDVCVAGMSFVYGK